MSAPSRSNWVAAAVMAGLLIAGGAARGATYTWDGDDDVNASGNWSDTAKWDPDSAEGRPNNTDDVTLPDVTTGERTITFDGTGTGARTLTLEQTTVGATNRLLLSQSMPFAWAVNGLTRNLTPAGTVIIDKGSYNFQPWWGSGQASPTATLGANVIVNSTGGNMQDQWDGPNTPLTFQGTVNLSSGVTTFGDRNTMTIDTGGTLNLTSGGGASVTIVNTGGAGTIIVKGTITGDNTGSLRARTLILDTGTAVSGITNIFTHNLSIRSANPAGFDLSGTRVQRFGKVALSIEVAASGTGDNFKVGTLIMPGAGADSALDANRTRLVNNYANSADQASEYFLLGTFNASPSWQNEFDFNGQRMVIDGGVANYTGGGGFRLSNRSAGHGVMEFRTPGGALNLNAAVGLSSGGTLEVVGPDSITGFNHADMGTTIGNNGGTFKFNGNVTAFTGGDISVSTANSQITIDLVSTANTFSSSRSFSVANGSTVTFNGSYSGSGAAQSRGLFAGGTAKSGTNSPPTVTPASRITITGDIGYSGDGLRMIIGRDAELRVGGNYSASWWNGVGGPAHNVFFADTSPHAGSFIFNGGGSVVQTMEVLSKGYAAITGLSHYQRTGTAPAAGQTVTGDSSGATATISLINGDILQLTGVSGTFEADETLTFSGGGSARAYDTQFTGLDGTKVNGATVHLPIGTLCIGDPAGTNASVKLVNDSNPWGVTEDSQVARNLIVTPNSTLDIASFKMAVAIGTNSLISGLVTNSVAGGTLILSDGATLSFGIGGVIDVDTLTIGADCTVDFQEAVGCYFRVNGNHKAAFDAMIGGQIVASDGGVVKTDYSTGDDHTTVYLAPPPSGTLILMR